MKFTDTNVTLSVGASSKIPCETDTEKGYLPYSLFVNTGMTSSLGGADKVAKFAANADFSFGPLSGGSVNPSEFGNINIPVAKQFRWFKANGTTGAYQYLMDGHSGGDELFSYSPRFCFYFNQGFQFGQPYGVTAREPRFIYLNPLGTATAGDPVRESISMNLNGNYWNGATAIQHYSGYQWVPTSATDGEFQFWTGMTSQPSGDGKLSSTTGGTKSFYLKNSGPFIPSGKVLTFPDGSTMNKAPDLQARTGNATLVGGTISVANTSVTAYTVIMLTRRLSGGTIGNLTYVKTPGVGFSINSDSATDTSRISYLLNEGTISDGAPVISGTNAVGDTLTVVTGGGSGTWQWYSNGSPVSGQTASTYVIRHQDIGLQISCYEDGIESNEITAWHPDDEAGYFADFRADLGTLTTGGGAATNGQPVEAWQDQSGNSRHLGVLATTNAPLLDTSGTGGRPTFLDFDGSNDYMLKSVSIARPYTVFVVAESKTETANERYFSAADSGVRMIIEPSVPTDVRNNGAITTGDVMPLNTRHIITGRTTLTLNGIRVDSGTEVTATETTGNGAGMFVGGTSAGSAANQRHYALLVYASDLDSSAQSRVRSYLKAKWGTP